MATVLLVIHLMIALALIVMILLQRSEGGALGMGGGGGGGLMSGRGVANLLTRTTAYLAAAFFATSITLAILAKSNRTPTSILDKLSPTAPVENNGASIPKPPASSLIVPAKPTAPSVPDSK